MVWFSTRRTDMSVCSPKTLFSSGRWCVKLNLRLPQSLIGIHLEGRKRLVSYFSDIAFYGSVYSLVVTSQSASHCSYYCHHTHVVSCLSTPRAFRIPRPNRGGSYFYLVQNYFKPSTLLHSVWCVSRQLLICWGPLIDHPAGHSM